MMHRIKNKMEKAYKLLALQEKISNNQAKELIDRGFVYYAGKRVNLARREYPLKSRFTLSYPQKIKKIYENREIIAVNKPVGITSEEVEKKFKGSLLVHRLDRDTSGVLLLAKNKEVRDRAIEEFKKKRVYKEYVAIVEGFIVEPMVIDSPIRTQKGSKAFSKIAKTGKEAKTIIEPCNIEEGKKSRIKVIIETGVTHQIRVHLKSIGYPIIGDVKYGGKPSNRLYLHAKKIKIFDYEIEAKEEF